VACSSALSHASSRCSLASLTDSRIIPAPPHSPLICELELWILQGCVFVMDAFVEYYRHGAGKVILLLVEAIGNQIRSPDACSIPQIITVMPLLTAVIFKSMPRCTIDCDIISACSNLS
jgi:hypothetical protein